MMKKCCRQFNFGKVEQVSLSKKLEVYKTSSFSHMKSKKYLF